MRLIDVTITIQIEDDTVWEEAAEEAYDSVTALGDLIVSVVGWEVGREFTQL